jgi:hypothetical protein
MPASPSQAKPDLIWARTSSTRSGSKLEQMKPAAALVVFAGLLTLSAGRASAQTDFSGTWTLDRDISGDPSKATFEPHQTQARRSTGGFNGGLGGRGGFGRRSGSGGRVGSSGARGTDGNNRNDAAALAVDERARLREMADYVKGFTSLVIVHSDHSTFAVTDAQGRSRLFLTDGSKTQYALATTTIDSTTRWDGPHIVTVYTIGPAHELVFTYVLVPATRQMALRIRLDESGRPRAGVPELRLVYTLKPVPPLTYEAIGGGHLLRMVTGEGRYITLEDGSRWEVVPEDWFTSVDWQPEAAMTVRIARGKDGFQFQLVNTNDDEGVLAKLLPPH